MYGSPRVWYIVLWDDDKHIAPLARAFEYASEAARFTAAKPGSHIRTYPRVTWPQSVWLAPLPKKSGRRSKGRWHRAVVAAEKHAKKSHAAVRPTTSPID